MPHPKTRRGSPAQFEAWLDRRLDVNDNVSLAAKLRVIRTSSKDVERWRASAQTSFASLDRNSDPDVRAALDFGFDVVRRDVIGDSTRAELGDQVFVLRMHHARGGKGAREIGVILHVGSTLFLYLLASARAADLEAEQDDRRGNAVTEIISSTVRRMTYLGAKLSPNYRPELHARDHNRIVRSEKHGADLKATLVRCRAIVFNPHRTDLTHPGQAQHFTFGTMLEAAAAESLIRGMNRSEIVIQSTGGYCGSIGHVPFTHGPSRYEEVDTRTGRRIQTVNARRLAPVEDVDAARVKLRALVDKILEDASGRPGRAPRTNWQAVGNLAAELGLPARRPEDVRKGTLLSDLGPSGREQAVKRLFGDAWIEGWRSGSFIKLVPIKTQLDLELDDEIELVVQGGRQYYRCRVDMPLPEGGWGVTDEEWHEVRQRLQPNTDKHRNSSGERLPLAGLIEHDDPLSKRQLRLTTKSGRYQLVARPLSEAYNASGRRGWDRREPHEKLATLQATRMHSSIGHAMNTALKALGLETAPLTINGPCAILVGEDPDPVGRADEAVTEAQQALQDATDQLAGAEDHLNLIRGRARRIPDPDGVDRATRACDRADDIQRQARDKLTAAEAAAEKVRAGSDRQPDADEASVEVATADFVAAALIKCTTTAPAWLNQACEGFLSDWTVELVTELGHRPRVRWSCTMLLESVDSADLVRVPLDGEVMSTANRRTRDVTISTEDWAWHFFYRGISMAELASQSGLKHDSAKNSYLYTCLSQWLTPAVPDPCLRAALLHCPVPAVRRVAWSMVTGDVLATEGIDPGFVRHVRQVYGRRADLFGQTWCRDTHELPRRTAALLAAGHAGSAAVPDLLEDLGVGYEPLLRLARIPNSNSPTLSSNPAPYFTKNFARQTAKSVTKEFRLRTCPHADCPARMRGEQGRCTLIIRTPETEAGFGVLCSVCRRLPVLELRNVRFPADYARPWSGRFGPGSKKSARTERDSTFIDSNFFDPGPGDPLPDVGSQPRQWDGTLGTTPYDYIPAHVRRASALGARRFLIEGLNEAGAAAATIFIEEQGGRLAKKLRTSCAALIVPDTRYASPREAKARVLGVPVVDLADFLAREPSTWT